MLVIRLGLLGGNPATDKHRMVPPFLIYYMKRIVLLIAFIVYIFHVSAGIYTDPKSKVNYTYNSYDLNNSEAKVSSSPDASGDIKLLPSFFIEDKEYQVVSISDNAFKNCSNITSVAIPEGIKTIGKGAFWDCTNMISIEIPSSITSIRTYAFYGCKNIRNLYISDLTAWCKIGFGDDFSNPFQFSYVDSSNRHLYLNGKELTDIEIPEDIDELYGYIFCRLNFNSVTIPSSLKLFRSNVFYQCNINTVSYLSTSPLTKPKIGNHIYDAAFFSNAFGSCRIENVHVTSLKWLCEINNYSDFANFAPLYGVKHLYIDGEEIVDVVIPDDVKQISCYAFYGFDGLKTLKISDSVTSIGEDAFRGCYNLTSVVLGNSVTEIRSSAFSSCSNLKDVSFNNGLSTIGNGAFSGCKKLSSISLPESLTTIGAQAFWNCESLIEVNMPESVTSIGVNAFEGTSIYKSQPEGAYYVGNWCCGYKGEQTEEGEFIVKDGTVGVVVLPNVGTISIPSSVKYIEKKSLTSYLIYKEKLTNLKKLFVDGENNLDAFVVSQHGQGSSTTWKAEKLETVILGNEVKSIRDEQFIDLENLKTVVMGYGLRYIGAKAFKGCKSLEKIRIPNGVQSIGNEAFYNCTGLTTVTIPNSAKSIGKFAFYNDLNLVSVNSHISIPEKLDESVFSCGGGYDSRTIYYIATLYVPRGRTTLYKNVDAWKLFASIEEKEVAYELTYVLDGDVYKNMEIQPGITITPEPDPVKDGMVFTGWRTVPAEMPDHDVVVYGWFEPYTTGITEIKHDDRANVKNSNVWYTINGCRLPSTPTQKGIYIFDGKKIIIR